MADLQIVRSHPTHPPDAFEQERREVLEAVMATLASGNPNPDEMAACLRLTRHLSGTFPERAA
jgi:hypothetical protein